MTEKEWEMRFRELARAVEECDQKATKHEGEDGFIRSYLLTTGPWHRVLAKARMDAIQSDQRESQ